MKKLLPLIAFSVVAFSNGTKAEPEQAPATTPPETQSATPATSTVQSLSDAECLAIADYLQRLNRAAMNTRANGGPDGNRGIISTMKALAAEPREGVPDDFCRYVDEYCALCTAAQEKRKELQSQMRELSVNDSWDIATKIDQTDKKLRADKLALTARYSRASLLGSGWETKGFEQAKQDFFLRTESVRAYLELYPLKDKEKLTDWNRVDSYLRYLCKQPLPELTAESARRLLERMELLKHLDPGWRLEESVEQFGIREGATYAVRLPLDAATGCTWKLDESTVENPNYTIEWQQVPTAELKKPYAHGKDVQLANLAPSTPETMVALVHLNKAGTAGLRFVCTRKGDDEPLATKYVVFYVRRVDDYRPLMETDPLPEPEPLPKFEPGVASLTDNECLAIHRYLQMVFCRTAEACAKAVEEQERVQTPHISADVLPSSMMDAPVLPRDFMEYTVEYHNLYIRVRAASRALDRKEYNYRYGKGITKEQREELREQRKQVEQQKKDMWKLLMEKYPRAIILSKASAPVIIDSIYNSYSHMDAKAREFYAKHPEMKDASNKASKAAYFRYLAEERAGEEQTFEAARRHMERLNVLNIMRAAVGYSSPHRLYGTEGEGAESILLPLATETGFSWKLESPLAEDAAVQVEWRNLPSERLYKLEDLGLFERDIPLAPQTSIATVRFKKAGETKLHFVCTHPNDAEPLLTREARIEIRAREDEEILKEPASVVLPQGSRVAALTDAECEAIVAYIRQLRKVSLHMAADAIEQEESLSATDHARTAAAELTDGIPTDIRDFVHAYSALTGATQEKLGAIEQQLSELRKSDAEDIQEQARPLIRQAHNIRMQFLHDLEALKSKHPRAVFLCEQIGTGAIEEAICDLQNENELAKEFYKEHPNMKKGKRVTIMAYLRYCADRKTEETTAESARVTVEKLDLLSRLSYSQNGMYHQTTLSIGQTRPAIFPDDRSSGYSWKLATPLPEDSPVQVEWHTQPSAELLELQDIGVLSSWTPLPTSSETTIAGIRTVKAGKVTLHFIYSKEGEAKPLLETKYTIEVEPEED